MDQRSIASIGILGVLAELESATIRDVHDRLRHSFGRYWGASTGVLGPTMTRLEENGHVELSFADGGDPYRITDSGLEQLRSLLREPLEDVEGAPLQAPLLLKLGFLHHLPLEEQRREIDRLTDRLRTARSELVELQSVHEREVDDETDAGYRGELIRLRVFVLDAVLEWLETVEFDRSAAR